MPKVNRQSLPQTSMSPIQQFKQRWKDCEGCHLWETRRQVVLCRGTYPCDLVFVGEAPGPSEDSTGWPFDGPAGHLLDHIILHSVPTYLTYALTNLVCCIPISTETGKKVEEPDSDSVEACSSRLKEFVQICDPKLIIGVGKCSKEWLTPGFASSITFHKEIPIEGILHPAYMLRQNIAQRALLVQQAIVNVRSALEEHLLIS